MHSVPFTSCSSRAAANAFLKLSRSLQDQLHRSRTPHSALTPIKSEPKWSFDDVNITSASAMAAAIFAATIVGTAATNGQTAFADAAMTSPPTSAHATTTSTFDLPLRQSEPTLLEKVANADPSAVRQFSQQILSSPDLSQAFDQKTLTALVDGLEATTQQSAAAGPVQLAILRLLADASQQSIPTSFSNVNVARTLSLVVKDLLDISAEPWAHWIRRKIGLVSPESLPQLSETTSNFDLLQLAPQSTQPDLQGGIMFHALRLAANMARHSHLHPITLESPLLSQLCQLLTHMYNYPDYIKEASSHQYVDILRSTVLAVSALSKSDPSQVVSTSAHLPLLYYMSQRSDTVLQTYAAGGIRNLARHPIGNHKDAWNVQRQLVVANVCESLIAAMHRDASPKAKVFAILAFSDLMTSQHPKAHLIKKRLESSYQIYAEQFKDSDPIVARAACHSLLTLLGTPSTQHTEQKTPEQLISVLAEKCGPLVTAAFKKQDTLALKAVSALCQNEMIVSRLLEKGVLEYLVIELGRAKGEYWKDCIIMLKCLSEWPLQRDLISQRGALRAVMARPYLDDDGRWVAAILANMARDEDNHVAIAHGGLRVLLTAITSKNEEAIREGTRGLYNLSLGGVSKVIIEQRGALSPLIKAASSSDPETKRFAVGALAQISESLHLATTMIEADVVATLLNCAKEDSTLHKDIARCFAQLSQVTEVHGSLVKSGAVNWVAEMVERNGGRGAGSSDVMHFSMIAVCNVASSPGIARTALTDLGMIRTLTALASGFTSPVVSHNAKQAMSNLRGAQKAAAWSADGSSKQAQPG